ncbi:CMP deaminase [Candidatus Bathyarchaeota archaeon]|nr:CMP deaminase [Candidatus Bathyarchaeota archaeon]
MVDWDARFIELARHIAEWSKDRSTKVGAVIVDDNRVVISMGYNGFPRGIDDTVEEYHERPAKYKWTEHAERNAIFNAVRQGVSTMGCTIYLPWFPCMDCARAIAQAGITKVVAIEPNFDDERWGSDFRQSLSLFKQCGISVKWHEDKPPS